MYIKWTLGVIFAIALGASASPASAQMVATVERTEDDRFIAAIESNSTAHVQPRTNEFLNNITLKIEWWTLIGQAVEIYGFHWEPSGTYDLGGSRYLSQGKLSQYPDLLERFNGLRPSQIEVSFQADFYHDIKGFDESYAELQKFSPNNYSKIGGGVAQSKKVTRQIQLGKPGQMMMDLSPGSPRDWQSFLTWQSPSDEDPNLSAKNTFKSAKRVRFSNLRIESVELPKLQAESIYEAYQRLENTDDRENSGGQNAENTSFKKNDPWASASNGSREDSWTRVEDSASSSSRDPWAQNTSSGNFRTETRGSKNGVVSISGEILIPFREWKILRYEDGVAQVEQNKHVSKSCDKDHSYTISIMKKGFVGKDGGWINPPSEDVSANVNRNDFGMFLTSYPSDWSPQRREQAKRRGKERRAAAWQACEDQSRNHVSRL